MTTSTLTDIRTKVRRLTGRPSVQQISDSQIDDYINTFYLYDLPANIKLFTLHTTFEFLTTPNVDQYDLTTLQTTINGEQVDVLNTYTNFQPPIYISGYQSFWSQSVEQFFRMYPKLAEINTTLTGDGTVGPYTFALENSPVLQGCVTVGTIDSTEQTVKVIDEPQSRTTGSWLQLEKVNPADPNPGGTINYLTSEGSITFNNTIPLGNEITVTAVPYKANRPQALNYYDNIFTLRPVPDKVYKVSMNAYIIPTELLKADQNPELKQWWQYLAYGASKKIFEDSQDPDGVTQIFPGFKEQERLVLRRTIVQHTVERTATIYTEMTQFPFNNENNRF